MGDPACDQQRAQEIAVYSELPLTCVGDYPGGKLLKLLTRTQGARHYHVMGQRPAIAVRARLERWAIASKAADVMAGAECGTYCGTATFAIE